MAKFGAKTRFGSYDLIIFQLKFFSELFPCRAPISVKVLYMSLFLRCRIRVAAMLVPTSDGSVASKSLDPPIYRNQVSNIYMYNNGPPPFICNNYIIYTPQEVKRKPVYTAVTRTVGRTCRNVLSRHG